MRLSALSLIGGALLVSASPAFAGTQASLSGSTTFITPAGFTSTVSAESVLPAGFFFKTTAAAVLTDSSISGLGVTTKASLTNADVIVLPQFSLQGFSVAAESLKVGTSGVVTVLPGSNSSFSAAAATVLTNAAAAANPTATGAETLVAGVRVYNSTNIEFISAIIKAGAGVNGLD